MKTCNTCQLTKPLSEFHKHSTNKGGRQNHCKPCSSEKYKDYYAANKATITARGTALHKAKRAVDPDYYYRVALKHKFGMTLDEYYAKLAGQGGVCAICASLPGGKRLAVDHDRTCCPGERSCGRCIRDLLCSNCNTGTGIADNPGLLRRRADYVEQWSALIKERTALQA